MNKLLIGSIVLIVIVGAGIFFLGGNNSSPSQSASSINRDVTEPSPAPVQPTPTEEVSPLPSSQAIMGETTVKKEFVVTGKNFSFTPSAVTVKKGEAVKIVFKNADGFHDFKIDAFKVATQRINTGGEEIVEFVADKAGTFEYYCSVGSHRKMGMKGILTVK